MTRATILFIALVSVDALLGLLALAMAQGERQSRALRLWGWGLLVYAAGQMFFVVHVHSLVGLQVVAGNGLISLSALFTALGVYQHSPVRINRSLLVGGLAASVLAEIIGRMMNLGIIIDVATPTVYATLLYAVAAWLMIRRPPPGARSAARFMALAIVAVLVVWNVRLAVVWLSLGGSQDPERADLIFSLFAIAQILTVVSGTLGMLWIEVRLMQSDLKHAAFTDQLTGVLNRRAVRLRFDEEVARCKRLSQTFGLILFDVDHFKEINDMLGHHVGDRVLRQVARAMSRSKRTEDMLGRIGGEEFLVLLPHHDLEKSLRAAERLRQAVQTAQPDEEMEGPATVSGGVAAFPEDGETWDKLYVVADRRMYRAKNAGRNRVTGRGRLPEQDN